MAALGLSIRRKKINSIKNLTTVKTFLLDVLGLAARDLSMKKKNLSSKNKLITLKKWLLQKSFGFLLVVLGLVAPGMSISFYSKNLLKKSSVVEL